MTVKSQSSIGSSYTFGQLITYGGQETSGFDQLEANINLLPALNVLQCLNHHTLFGGPANVVWPTGSVTIGSNGNTAPVTCGPLAMEGTDTDGLGMDAIDDCLLAQHATNGFSFALFDSFGKLQHIYSNKMVVSRGKDGPLVTIGMIKPFDPCSIETNPLTDTLLTYLFNAFEIAGPTLRQALYGESRGGLTRSKIDLGDGKTLITIGSRVMSGTTYNGSLLGFTVKA